MSNRCNCDSERYQVMGKFNPPTCFDFAKPQEWPDWKKRWERYRAASELEGKSGRTQVSSLIYAMGADAETIFESFNFDEEGEDGDHDAVLAKFDAHFVPKVNTIYERAKFHRRIQKPGENVETYIRSLYELSTTCGFEDKDTRIRDQLVIGISDKKTSEKLQLQDDLELTDAIDICRTHEQVKEQMASLSAENNLDAVAKRKVSSRRIETHTSGRAEVDSERPERLSRRRDRFCETCHRSQHNDVTSDDDDDEPCPDCGLEHRERGRCPAAGKRCNVCERKGHFAAVCPEKRRRRRKPREQDELYEEEQEEHESC